MKLQSISSLIPDFADVLPFVQQGHTCAMIQKSPQTETASCTLHKFYHFEGNHYNYELKTYMTYLILSTAEYRSTAAAIAEQIQHTHLHTPVT